MSHIVYMVLDDKTFRILAGRVKTANASLRVMTLEEEAEAWRRLKKESVESYVDFRASCGAEKITIGELCAHYVRDALK